MGALYCRVLWDLPWYVIGKIPRTFFSLMVLKGSILNAGLLYNVGDFENPKAIFFML
jgi:hypothetical protein